MRAPDASPFDMRVERIGTDQDLDGVLDVEAESFTNPWTREMYVSELRNESVCYVYVARVPDHPVAAFCAFWLIVDEMHIHNVAVRPSLRGRGLGTTLLRQVLHEAARLGATRATLEVRASNEGARRLYERLGFRVTATRRGYYSAPVEDALVLWLEDIRQPSG